MQPGHANFKTRKSNWCHKLPSHFRFIIFKENIWIKKSGLRENFYRLSQLTNIGSVPGWTWRTVLWRLLVLFILLLICKKSLTYNDKFMWFIQIFLKHSIRLIIVPTLICLRLPWCRRATIILDKILRTEVNH